MKKCLLKYGFIFTMTALSGGVLMNISQRVQRAEYEVRRYDRLIASEEEAIRALKADWAYLNDPERLEKLATQNLDMTSPNPDDILSDPDMIPDNALETGTSAPPTSPLHRDISYGGTQ